MGCFGGGANDEDTKKNKEIDKQIMEEKKKRKFDVKLLLLGTGESGKTTILRQMKFIHDGGYTAEEKEYFKEIIYNNVMHSMRNILHGMDKLAIVLPDNLQEQRNKVIHEDALFDPKPVEELWKDRSIQEAFSRSREYQLYDSAKYFFDSIQRISVPDYLPNQEDILRCRVKTTGISETHFKVGELTYTMVDVGGQRSERRKWVHCFENVTAVIFVVAASAYDQTLIEDESVNRMIEALTLFENICSGQWFIKTSMILFLNKTDILKNKLPNSPLAEFFPDYTGDNSYEDVIAFFSAKFRELNQNESKHVYIHETCATDTKQIGFVMAAVNDIIIQKNLRNVGLL